MKSKLTCGVALVAALAMSEIVRAQSPAKEGPPPLTAGGVVVEIRPGETAKFSVTFSRKREACASLYWQHNGAPIGGWNSTIGVAAGPVNPADYTMKNTTDK